MFEGEGFVVVGELFGGCVGGGCCCWDDVGEYCCFGFGNGCILVGCGSVGECVFKNGSI